MSTMHNTSDLSVEQLQIMLEREMNNYAKYLEHANGTSMEPDTTMEMFLRMKEDIISELKRRVRAALLQEKKL